MSSFRIHSKYNPHKEAEQFVSAIEGSPRIIVICEPGESYLADALRLRFPQAKLIAVRYTAELFQDSDSLWDAVWRPVNGSLPFFLVSQIPDEKLGAARFLSWKPADKAFPEAASAVWEHIRSAIEIIKSIMHTRAFFGNRWLKNTVYNFAHLVYPVAAEFGSRDFILAGAGPSLQDLRRNETAGFSIAAVCSAYPALVTKNIHIDLCISTDGGYWASRHFDGIQHSVPVAFPLEAAVPTAVLTHNPCIPLSYNSPLEQALFAATGLIPLSARENGTVTGTACDLLLTHTKSTIILAGLDLASSCGFSHAQPHNSTTRFSCTTDRVRTLAGMLAVQNFQTGALETYRQWFLQQPPVKTDRLFRTGVGGCTLPNIRHINSPATMPKQCGSQMACDTPFSVRSVHLPISTDRKKAVRELLTAAQKRISLITERETEVLTSETPSLERQICALCSYTAYCNVIKAPTNREMQAKLSEEVTLVLDHLIQRMDYDGV